MQAVEDVGAALRRDLGLLTEEEVAAAFKRDVRTLRNWRSARTGPPFVKIGRDVFYRRDAVSEFIARGETETD